MTGNSGCASSPWPLGETGSRSRGWTRTPGTGRSRGRGRGAYTKVDLVGVGHGHFRSPLLERAVALQAAPSSARRHRCASDDLDTARVPIPFPRALGALDCALVKD